MKPTTDLSPRDWEALSAYLDDALPPRERARLEARLAQEASLAQALAELQALRTALRDLPKPRAPRNFTLTPEAVTPRRRWMWGWAVALGVMMAVGVLVARWGMGGLRPMAAAPPPEEQPAMVAVPGPDLEEKAAPGGEVPSPEAPPAMALEAAPEALASPTPEGREAAPKAQPGTMPSPTPTLSPRAPAPSAPPVWLWVVGLALGAGLGWWLLRRWKRSA